MPLVPLSQVMRVRPWPNLVLELSELAHEEYRRRDDEAGEAAYGSMLAAMRWRAARGEETL